MLILSNCFTETVDEGCLKVANSLVKRLKWMDPDVTVVSYERESSLADTHLKLNKLFWNRKLIELLWKREEAMLHIPFPAPVRNMLFRVLWLSLISTEPVYVLFSMTGDYRWMERWLLRLSGARVIALSRQASDFYKNIIGADRVIYLKTGVDTEKFVPVSLERAQELRKKYGLDPNRKTVLHVGHLKAGRNIAQLEKLNFDYQVLLVTSTLTKSEQDQKLREKLESCGNIRILDSYLPDIQEIYQLSDVYFFPVTDASNCIEVPLSVLEAAACGKPVVTTAFGELKELRGKDGFFFLENFERDHINGLVERATRSPGDPRAAVLPYDWKNAVSALLK